MNEFMIKKLIGAFLTLGTLLNEMGEYGKAVNTLGE